MFYIVGSKISSVSHNHVFMTGNVLLLKRKWPEQDKKTSLRSSEADFDVEKISYIYSVICFINAFLRIPHI